MTNIGDITAGVGFVINQADLMAKLRQAEQLIVNKPIQIRVGLDPAYVAAQTQKLTDALARAATIKLRLDTTSIGSEVRRLQGLTGTTLNMNFKVTGTVQAVNDINTLKTLLASLQTSSNLRITTDVTALQAVNTQIGTQIAQLTALIAQLRGLNGGGGPGPGGGGGGAGGLPAGVRSTILEIERLNNLFTRGQISGQNYSQALTAMQGRLEGARAAAGRGTEDFAAIDRQITKLTSSLRGINTDSLTKIRTDMAGVRTAFDAATGGISRDSQQFRDAAAAYQTGAAQIEARLRAMAAQGNLTAQQMGNVNRMLGTLAREQGTLTGGLNPMGLSGNVFNALRSAFPILQQMGGSLGAAASSSSGLIQSFAGIASAAGPMGIAVAAAAVAIGSIAAVAMNTTKVFASFEHSMQGVKAVSDTTGKTFDALKGQALTLAQDFGVSLETVAQAQEELYKAGRTTEDVMGGAARGVIVLSKATGTDLLNAVSIANSAMNVFGLKGTDMGMVADVIANGANKTALDVNTLGVSLQQVGNVAASSGLDLQQTVAVLGMMADKGMAGSDAGTSLKTMLQRLKSPTDDANAALLKHGVAVYDATGKQRDMIDILKDTISSMNGMTDSQRNAFAQTVFGADAVRAITVMYSNGSVKLDEYIKNVDEKGRAERDAKTRAEGLTGSQEKLNASMQVFKTSVGELFSGPMLNAINNMERLVTSATRIIDNLHGANVELQEWGQQVGIDVTRLSAADQNKAQIDLVQLQGNISAEQRKSYMQELEKLRLSAVQTQGGGTFSGSGPLLPGQTRGAAADAAGLRILDATTTATGNHAADDLIGWCARWVKLTLEKAQPGAKAQIEQWFGGDADTVKNRLVASEKLQKYSGNVNDLAPGDVVVYDKNHIGIYIGNGMVRGNNEWGGKNGAAITDEKINSLGSIAGIVKAIDAASGFTARAQKGGATDLTPPVLPITDKQIAQAQKYAAALEKAQKAFKDDPDSKAAAKAVDAAQQAMKAWSDASEGNARALGIVQSNLKGATRAAGQYIATQADLNKYGERALQLIKAQELANKSGSDEAVTKANADMAAFTKDSARRAAVVQIEQTAYQARKADEAQGTADSVRLAEGVAQAKIDAAQGSVDKLKQIQSDELANADTAAQKLAVIQKTSTAIYKGELATAEQVRQKAYAAAEKEANPALKAQARATADAAYNKAQSAAALARTQALNAAERASSAEHDKNVKDAAKARAETLKALREDDVKSAQASLNRLKEVQDRALALDKDNLVKQLADKRNYAKQVHDLQVQINQAEYDQAVKEANSGRAQQRLGLLKIAKTNLESANLAAQNTQNGTVATATDAVTTAVQKQRDAYHALADTLRQHVEAGDLDSKTQQDLTHQFNLLGVETGKLGLTTEKHVAGARAATFALIGQGQAAYLTAQRMQGMVSGNTEAADSALTVAESLDSVGQRGPAIELLTGVLSGLMDSAARGEASADSVDKLRVALAGLTEAQAAETQAQDFLSGLDGSIDEQIAAITAKLEDPNTTVELRKAISDMAQDFGGSVTPGPMGEAATAALLAQRNKDVSGQIGGLDTLTGARLQGAMKDASDYLASEVGKQLEPATQEALQKAIDRAAAYMKASELLDLINKNPQDYADGARGLPAPSPYDPAGDTRNLADQRVITSSRQQQASTLLEAQHAQGLIREADYLQRRRDLDEAAAAQSLLDADQDGKNHAVSLAAYTAEMLAINTKYQTDKKALDEKDREAERAAANAHAANMLALERSNAAAALEVQHNRGSISERGYIDAQEAQAKQVALDKYLDAFNTSGSDMVLAWAQYQADLTAATNKGVQDRIALDKAGIDSFISGLQQIGGVFEQLDGMAGLFGKTLGGLASGLGLFQSITSKGGLMDKTSAAFGSGGSFFDKLGAVGGWLGVASEAINLIGGIGDAIMNLSPGFAAWKKGLLEVADAEKKAIGGAGNTGIKSPWQDALEKDAGSREKLANAGFWQRIAWGLFGGAPEVMSSEAAKLQSALQTIFNGLADGIGNAFTSSMSDAFSKGDMSDWAANFDKTFDETVGKVILNTMITAALESGAVANDLADLTTAIKNQDYGAIPGILTRVKAHGHDALAPIASIAPSLPGYGSGSEGGMQPYSNASIAGAAPAAQFGIPELQFPAIFTTALTNIGNLDVPGFNASTKRLMDAANLIVDTLGSRGTSRSGLSGY